MTVEAIEKADNGTRNSNVATEAVGPHEIVEDANGVVRADGSGGWDGVALSFESAPWIHEHDEATGGLVYQSSQNDRVPYGGDEDGAVIRPLTIEETTNGVTSTPDIGEDSVVGVPDTTTNDGPDSPGRVVEEGYSNDENDDSTTTTFDRSNDNFVAIGRALPQGGGQLDVSGYGEQIRVRVDKSL